MKQNNVFDLPYNLSEKRVWICGHNGMVGSALLRRLSHDSTINILTTERSEVDLVNQADVKNWVSQNKPDAIFLAAAKVGGIHANNIYPADFSYLNIMIAANVIQAAYESDVEKLLYLGSSCIYPKLAPQPMKEETLLSGPLEPTNQWYAIAKISGIMMAQAHRLQHGCDFISAMPTNLYGRNDNFHPENSHVIPALMRKIHNAKKANAPSIEIWGTGKIYREFMHADDCADGLVFLMKNYSQLDHINLGTGYDVTILELTETLMRVIGYGGKVIHDLSKPDGPPKKMMDSSKLAKLGWVPQYTLEEGLRKAYQWFLANEGNLRSS